MARKLLPRVAVAMHEPSTRLAPGVATVLLTGTAPNTHLTSIQMRTVWRAHREALLARWIADHPGSRPWAWWQLEPHELRLQLGGKGVRIEERIRNMRVPPDRGLPCFAEIDDNDPPTFEGEGAYLERRGLLVDGERDRIPPSAFEPVTIVDE